jgi:predicted TIM-barrel fold metal-dependent hydrolase
MHKCTATLIPGLLPQGIEFPIDTTRTITSLVLNGTRARTPDVKYIFSHGGGALPFLAARIAHTAGRNPAFAGNNPRGVEFELKRLYCDTASAESAPQFAAMMQFFPTSHILYGSDAPFVTPHHSVEELDKIALSMPMRAAIERENALAILPRVKATGV